MDGGVELDDLFNADDLPDINKYIGNLPNWLNKILDNLKHIAIVGGIILGGLALLKLLDMAGILGGILSPLKNIITNLSVIRTLIFGLGIYAIIMGVITAVKGLEAYIKNPTWENFREIIKGITIAMAGLLAVMIAVGGAAHPVLTGISLLGTAIGLLIIGIGDFINKENEVMTAEERERKQEERLKKSMEELKRARESLTNATNDYINAVDKAEESERKLKDAQSETGISIDELLAKMEQENLTYADLDENQRKVYKAYMDNKGAQEQLKNSTDNLKTAEDEQIKRLGILIGTLEQGGYSHEEYKKKVVDAWQKGKISAEDASIAIMHRMRNMSDSSRQTFTQDLPNDIRTGLDPNKYNAAASKLKNWWNNSLIGGLKKNVTLDISGVVRTSWFKTGFASGGLVKMATGGLINLPGRGVPLSSAIGGEAGKEGIVPLTDTQAMAELGREIGKWIQVNTTVVNNMNGRQLSREVHRLDNEQDFAFNN